MLKHGQEKEFQVQLSFLVISSNTLFDDMTKKLLDHPQLKEIKDQKFIEENGRKLFLLFLKSIINGTGNYYIEARTRDNKRTDIIIDYKGKQFIIELKIWRGNEYNQRARQAFRK